jgi:hypothetical protein
VLEKIFPHEGVVTLRTKTSIEAIAACSGWVDVGGCWSHHAVNIESITVVMSITMVTLIVVVLIIIIVIIIFTSTVTTETKTEAEAAEVATVNAHHHIQTKSTHKP